MTILSQEELEDYLTELRCDGENYDYIEGFRKGHNSNVRIVEIEDFLDLLREEGENYDYIKGYDDGFHF